MILADNSKTPDWKAMISLLFIMIAFLSTSQSQTADFSSPALLRDALFCSRLIHLGQTAQDLLL